MMVINAVLEGSLLGFDIKPINLTICSQYIQADFITFLLLNSLHILSSLQLYTEGWHHWKAGDDAPQPFPYLLSHVLPVGQKSE